MNFNQADTQRNNGNGSVLTVKDCVGFGDVIGHLKDILFWFLNSRQRHLDNEARKLRNRRLELENAAFLAHLAKTVGSNDEDVRSMLFDEEIGRCRLIRKSEVIEGEACDKA